MVFNHYVKTLLKTVLVDVVSHDWWLYQLFQETEVKLFTMKFHTSYIDNMKTQL